ncbi:MAG: hypothetical protein ACTS3F_04545 [Phycisphaerales bacterium]
MPAAAQLAPQHVTREAALEALTTNADQTLEVIRQWQSTHFDGADCNGYESVHAALESLESFHNSWRDAPPEREPLPFIVVHFRHFDQLLGDDPQDEVQQMLGDAGRAWLIQQRCEYLRLVEESGLIDAIDEALQCRHYHPDRWSLFNSFNGAGWMFPKFSNSAFLTTACNALLKALAANDPESAANWTRRWINLTAAGASQDDSVHRLYAAGRISALSSCLRRAIVSYDINATTLAAIAHAMDNARPMPNPSDIAALERLVPQRTTAVAIFAMYEEAHGHWPDPGPLLRRAVPTKDELAAATAELRLATEMRILYDESTGPARAPADAMRETLIEQLQAPPKWHNEFSQFIRESAIRNLENPKIVTGASSASTRLAGTRLMVAIEWMRADTGRLPESLDDLIPKYAQTATGCNFAADGRFRYRLLDPDATGPGSGYLLYSVAPDGLDNAGRTDEQAFAIDDRILKMSVQEAAGLDWVINEVEPFIFLPQDAAACRPNP